MAGSHSSHFDQRHIRKEKRGIRLTALVRMLFLRILPQSTHTHTRTQKKGAKGCKGVSLHFLFFFFFWNCHAPSPDMSPPLFVAILSARARVSMADEAAHWDTATWPTKKKREKKRKTNSKPLVLTSAVAIRT